MVKFFLNYQVTKPLVYLQFIYDDVLFNFWSIFSLPLIFLVFLYIRDYQGRIIQRKKFDITVKTQLGL